MNVLHQVLVVDSGLRGETDLLSAELAELGLSSVTASFEAADEVLDVIKRPSAIFLNVPPSDGSNAHAGFMELAVRLRAAHRTAGIPVIVWDHHAAMQKGGISAVLKSEIGLQVLSGPEF